MFVGSSSKLILKKKKISEYKEMCHFNLNQNSQDIVYTKPSYFQKLIEITISNSKLMEHNEITNLKEQASMRSFSTSDFDFLTALLY